MPTPDELFEKWTPWAVRLARRYAERIPNDQMFQKQIENAALFGLWDACKKFEECRGWKFTTYARLRVRGAIGDELRENDLLSRRERQLQEIETPVFVPVDNIRSDGIDYIEIRERGDFILAAIRSLRGRNRVFAELRWFRGMRLKQIGAQLNLSESRIAQIHKEVLTILKEWAAKRCE